MMRSFVLAILISLVVAAGLLVWILSSRPTATEVTNTVRPAPVLPARAIPPEVEQALESRQSHGTLPVLENPASPPRTSPFE